MTELQPLALAHAVKRRIHRAISRCQGKEFVHFLHVGKTGGTALKHALDSHRRLGRRVLELHEHRTRLLDIRPGDRVFFVVRDPVSRFVSGFYSRKRQGAPRFLHPWTPAERRAFQAFETPNRLAMALLSHDGDERRRAAEAMASIRHVRSSYWDWFGDEAYFVSRLPDVLFIGFQENLDADFETLKRILALPPHLKLPAADVHAHRTPPHLDAGLEPAAIARLRDWYARDYAFLRLCEELAPRVNGSALAESGG
jgi:hypothetical protein